MYVEKIFDKVLRRYANKSYQVGAENHYVLQTTARGALMIDSVAEQESLSVERQ